jgi:hypothetical protein
MLKKFIESYAKYGAFGAVGFEWLAMAYFYLREPAYFSGQYPISYFASLPSTSFAFSGLYLLAAISFWLFANHYLKAFHKTPILVFAVSMTTFAALALFPYNPNIFASALIHNILAMMAWGFFIVGMVLMALQSDDRFFSRVTSYAIALSILLMMSFVLLQKGTIIMFLEAGSWFVCQVWTIWLSYRTYKKEATDSLPNN